jgi:hypothetical protein
MRGDLPGSVASPTGTRGNWSHPDRRRSACDVRRRRRAGRHLDSEDLGARLQPASSMSRTGRAGPSLPRVDANDNGGDHNSENPASSRSDTPSVAKKVLNRGHNKKTDNCTHCPGLDPVSRRRCLFRIGHDDLLGCQSQTRKHERTTGSSEGNSGQGLGGDFQFGLGPDDPLRHKHLQVTER